MDRFITINKKDCIVADKNKDTNTSVLHNSDSSSSNSDDNIDNEEIIPKKKAKVCYKRKFKDEWKNKFGWIENTNGKSYCKVCCKTVHGGLTHLERHQSSSLHKKNFKKAEKTPVITSFLNDEKLEKHNDPVLNYVSQFEPKKALDGEIPSIAIDTLKLFPHFVNDIEKLNTEWRLLSDLEDLKKYKDLNVEEFWNQIFVLKNELNEEMFPNLTLLVKSLLAVPHSSAAAERGFSQLNLLKTKVRNRLLVTNCDSILHAKQMLNNNTCFSWKPKNSLLKRKPSY